MSPVRSRLWAGWRTAGRRSGPSGRALAVLLVLVAALAGSCTGTVSQEAEGRGEDLGLAHVHGMGVNPADGQLYAASHYGMYRIAEGTAERMGQLIQDTMGFTIAGPNRFLGSGHPDLLNDTILAADDPPLLGLIESTDGGGTWDGRSLQGEVDFHALGYAHGRAYGADSTNGRFMVSTDLETWETRSDVALISFAVSPDDADLVVGTAEQGTLRSTDGGRTWGLLDGGPRLVFLAWDPQAGLWGLAADGSVHESPDGGIAWAERGRVSGTPAALHAHPTGLYAATSEAIRVSADGGITWEDLYEIR